MLADGCFESEADILWNHRPLITFVGRRLRTNQPKGSVTTTVRKSVDADHVIGRLKKVKSHSGLLATC